MRQDIREYQAQYAQEQAAKKAARLEADVRAERNRLLTECDWTQLADVPELAIKWMTYRQALRDIPQQEGFPENVIWPEKP